MSSLLKSHIFSRWGAVFIFIVGAVGFNVFYADAASALWEDQVPWYRTVYLKTGTNTVIANKSTNPSSPVWVRDTFIPRITTDGRACDSGNNVVARDFDTRVTFNNCEALTIQEVTSNADNNTWFQQANISYVIGDFDSAETISIGRGYIVESGASAVGTPRGQTARAERNAGVCDNPNPNRTERCSLLIYFSRGDPGDWHISLDNVYNNGNPSSGHEYWYDGPVTAQYRTLTFDPNGGSVADTSPQTDGAMLLTRTSGGNVLREYIRGRTANRYPVPTRAGYTFAGWYTAATGGSPSTSRTMNGDEVLYAHWTPVISWNLNGSIAMTSGGTAVANGASVGVNQVITFNFRLTNAGPNSATGVGGNVSTQYLSSYPANTAAPNTTNYSNQTVTTSGLTPVAAQTITVPGNAPAGSQVCKTLYWDHDTQTGGTGSVQACVRVAAYGRLTPRLQVQPDSDSVEIDSGQDIDADFIIENTSNTPWSVNGRYCFFMSTTPSPTSPSGTCSTGTYNNGSLGAGGLAEEDEFTVPDGNMGRYACISWQLTSPSPAGVNVIGTNPVYNCRQVIKSPKVVVMGNDLRVGGTFSGGSNLNSRIIGSISSHNGHEYGSWSEYSLMAPGAISGLGSGTGLNTFNAASNPEYSKLTFANIPALGLFSSPANMGAIPDVRGYLTEILSGSSVVTASPAPASWTYDPRVYVIDGNVTIAHDIIRSSNYSPGIAGIQQMVIIANNITIDPSVRRIDAWLVAPGGNINTCYTSDTRLSATVCDEQLRINGPVMAASLQLRRTYGEQGEGAEVINMRGDAYVWMHRMSERYGSLTTTYTRELPPRY